MLEVGPDPGPGAVQEDPLVAFRDPENGACLHARESLHIPQRYHRALTRRESLDQCMNSRGKIRRGQTVDDFLLRPVSRRGHPPAVLAEPTVVRLELPVLDRKMHPLADAGADRPVDDDAEQPGPQ